MIQVQLLGAIPTPIRLIPASVYILSFSSIRTPTAIISWNLEFSI